MLCSLIQSITDMLYSGMNYTLITDNVIVGSQPQKPEDIEHRRHEENVAYILNLQQDKDIEYWGIDLLSIIQRCQQLGIRHMRRPVRKCYSLKIETCRRLEFPKLVIICFNHFSCVHACVLFFYQCFLGANWMNLQI